jgi:hypothetical protein
MKLLDSLRFRVATPFRRSQMNGRCSAFSEGLRFRVPHPSRFLGRVGVFGPDFDLLLFLPPALQRSENSLSRNDAL